MKARAIVHNTYFEKNNTKRFSTQLGFDHKLNDKSSISVKNHVSFYDRTVEIPSFKFSGIQVASFSEANYQHKGERTERITGVNLITDKFTESKLDSAPVVDYQYSTLGVFVQNTWNATEKFILETGFRLDYQNEFGIFALPRVSALLKMNKKLSFRLGGGLGYKTPTIFTEDAERIQFRNVLPIAISSTTAAIIWWHCSTSV